MLNSGKSAIPPSPRKLLKSIAAAMSSSPVDIGYSEVGADDGTGAGGIEFVRSTW